MTLEIWTSRGIRKSILQELLLGRRADALTLLALDLWGPGPRRPCLEKRPRPNDSRLLGVASPVPEAMASALPPGRAYIREAPSVHC